VRMARELAELIGVRPLDSSPDQPELRQAAERLGGSGYRLRNDPDLAAMASYRADYQSCVDALARHLGKPTAVLVRQS